MPRPSVRNSVPLRSLSKRRWTTEDARTVLELFEKSRKSMREFAEAEGLDAQRLYRWRALIARRSAPPTMEIPRPLSPLAVPVEVVLRSGRVVRVPDGFSDETLRRVVAALGDELPSC
jgi:transposase-like protein